jgi:hypothetical protein
MEKKKLMSNDKFGSLRYSMSRKDIMTFVSGLHDIQMDMIETTVIAKERQGFPEANVVIKHIMEKK